MLRIKLIIFAISSSLIPWSTSITGPIHQHSYNVSESGSGSGMSPEQFDFCGYSSLQESVNQDSIKRLPVSVWIMLLVTLIPNYIARFVNNWQPSPFVQRACTVEPLNKGHVETSHFVLCRENVLSSEANNVLYYGKGNILNSEGWYIQYQRSYSMYSVIITERSF